MRGYQLGSSRGLTSVEQADGRQCCFRTALPDSKEGDRSLSGREQKQDGGDDNVRQQRG